MEGNKTGKILLPPKDMRLEAMGNNSGQLDPYPNKVVTSRYTVLSFILFDFIHQIRKGSTLFFFITLLLLLIPKISPFEPYTYLLAFGIVVGVSMVKDAMEDYKRHKDDEKLNTTKVEVVKCKEMMNKGCEFIVEEKNCMELRAGDYILVKRNEEIHADVVVMRAKSFHKDKLVCTNHCFIETASLDGESNLKKRNSLDSPEGYECCKMKNFINRETNNQYTFFSPCFQHYFKNVSSIDLKDTGDSFEDFECDINICGKLEIANEKNVILRGSILKNTESCLCLVVGVGESTKLSKSLHKVHKSKTIFDTKMNHILCLVLGLYASMMVVTAISGALFLNSNQGIEYLNISSFKSSIITLIFSNYILYMYLIPLSLYVMLELARFVHSMGISYDTYMTYDGVKSKCRNSNALEDLGLIDFILTDKTGTITKNSMTLKAVHQVNGDGLVSLEELCGSMSNVLCKMPDKELEVKIEKILTSSNNNKSNLLFILNMLVCNSVEILNGKAEGISQEELCFLESLKKHGYKLVEREEDFVIIEIMGQRMKINILGTLEFSSKKQRMCNLVQIGNRCFLLTKGSDQKLLNKKQDKSIIKIINSSNDFRSLVMKYREISTEEKDKFLEAVEFNLDDIREENNEDGKGLLKMRKKKEEESFSILETGSEYLGASFIEDELQDEVQDTMKMFKKAGIKVWMITGDKKETAVACAKNSCITEEEDFLALSGIETLKALERELEPINIRENDSESIFDTQSLVVYRATPSQKGKIAALMTKIGKNILSIGDGNNDVPMLKNSHVGIGIMGKEGTQAALSADFAIPQFNLLKNLIFVHGRYCLQRYTKTALNSYYKNIVFIFVQFIYNLYSGSSGRPLYNSFVLNYYNIFFTSMIPFSVALFDQDKDRDTILSNPELIQHPRLRFKGLFIYLNVGFALFEAILIFYLVKFFMLNDISNSSGILGGYSSMSTVFSICIIFTVILRQIRSISFRTKYTDLAVGMTILLNVISIFWLQDFYTRGNYVIYYLIQSPYFYFLIIGLFSIIYIIDTIFMQIDIYFIESLNK